MIYCDRCKCTFEDKGLNKVRHKTGRCAADPDRVHPHQVEIQDKPNDN